MEKEFSRKRTYSQFLSYVFPSIISMIFLSFYTTIDGFFVSRYVGPDALAAISIIIPITCLIFGIAIMLATGSGALVGMKLGENKKEEALGFFSFVTYTLLGIAVVMTVIGTIYIRPIVRFLGATEVLMPYAVTYGVVTVWMIIPMVFKLYFEYYARVDGNPKISLVMSSVGLIGNVVFDFIFIVVMDMGILGAACGTFVAMTLSALIGLGHFFSKRAYLKFTKPLVCVRLLWDSCVNGSSEMLTEWSTGITTFLFNLAAIHFYGEAGVAAMSIIMYIYYFFIAVYFGVTVGIGPVISYNAGAGNKERIRESMRHSWVTIGWSSIVLCSISLFLGKYIVAFFTPDPTVYRITVEGLQLFSFTFLCIGINVFLSGYFTAIGNGKVSAVISAARSLVFVTILIMVLPRVMGVSGVWLAMPLSELFALFLSFPLFLKKGRGVYIAGEEN